MPAKKKKQKAARAATGGKKQGAPLRGGKSPAVKKTGRRQETAPGAADRQLEPELRTARASRQPTGEGRQPASEGQDALIDELRSVSRELQAVNDQLQRKIAELEVANNDLMNLLASTDMATIFLDREFRLRRFTPAATTLLRAIDTDVGRPISDLAMNVADDNLLADSERVLLQLTPVEQEVHDDQDRWYNRRILPYRTDDDRIDGVVVTFNDITQQKEAEAQLRELAVRLEKRVTTVTAQVDRLVDQAPDAMVVVDERGMIVHLNTQAEVLFDYSRAELAGEPVDRLIPERFRQGHLRYLAEYFAHPYPRPMGAGLQLYAVAKDGREFPADIQLSPLDLSGQFVTLAAVRDVTQQVRAEALERRLATVVNTSPFSIVVGQTDGTIESWNEGAARLYGYTAVEAVGQSVRMLVPPDKAEEFEWVHRSLSWERPVHEFETVRLHKSGNRVDVAVILSAVKSVGESVQGFCAISRDIGERKRLEQEMAELTAMDRQRLAMQLHDTVSQQISGVSMLAASLKGQLPSDSPVQDTLDNLEAAADKAKRQLGDLARGMFPVEVDESGLRVALKGLADELAGMYNVACQFECPEKVAMEDNYTATHLYLIAREAAYNAVRHAKAGEIVIRLTEGDEGVGVSVRDDGVGMAASDEDRHHGMGTQIMQHRCRLVRGTLKIDSAPGEGTSVACRVRRRLRG